ncbi:MAG: acetolactate synthase small subunit [Candidatus Wallacebacter cryptica]|jgi:acetolactate synthase-1/3 small subunit|nr:acetolactate synthase small subunit [Bacillota bacterium]
MKRYVISVLVDNHSGVLSRVAGLFSRRGYNIDSISVGETLDPTVSRMTIVAHGDDAILEQITKQLSKLVDVLKVAILPDDASVYRELVLLKVKADDSTRATISDVIDVFRAKIVDIAPQSMTVEITGDRPKIQALVDLLSPHGILEVVRTGLIGLHRGDQNILTQEEI